MAREFLYLVQESAYKTPVGSPVVGTSSFYVRLDGSNAFTMRPRPVMVEVPYGGGVAITRFRVSDKLECKGRLQCKLYAGALSKFLMQWAAQTINAGQTTPWTTTEPAGDLASVAVYHAIQRSDGTYKRRVYLGTKVDSWSVEVSEDSTIATITLELSASTPQGNQFDSSTDPTAGTFAAPTDAQLPNNPYVFIHAASGLTIGSSRTSFSSVRIGAKNVLARRYWANRFVQLMRYVGRSTTLEATQFYLATPDDRTSYEGLTSLTTSLALSNGTNSITWTLNSTNPFTSLEDQLPLNDLYLQAGTIANEWDDTAGNDFTLAFT